ARAVGAALLVGALLAPAAAVYADTPAATNPADVNAANTTTAVLVPSVVADHQYGMNMFIWGHADTTGRDLGGGKQAGFTWQKTLFSWRDIEGKCKGCYDWNEADRVAKSTIDAGVKLLVRIDFEPDWSRADRAHNGHPDNLADYAEFVQAVANRYKPGSPN